MSMARATEARRRWRSPAPDARFLFAPPRSFAQRLRVVRALLLLPLVAVVGCSGAPVACWPTFEYRIMADVSTAPRAACQVDFRAGTTIASYAFQTLPEPYLEPCFEQHAQPACTPLDGSPQPSWCEASVCWINFIFSSDVARDLSSFMGADSFRMQVTCGGQAVQDTTVQPVRQTCGG
jgi:hypothetical protein